MGQPTQTMQHSASKSNLAAKFPSRVQNGNGYGAYSSQKSKAKEFWNIVLNSPEKISQKDLQKLKQSKRSIPLATKSSKSSSRDKRNFLCDSCGALFQRIGHLNTHKETVHEGKRPHLCPYGCGKIYGHRSSLNRHIRSVHETLQSQPSLPAYPQLLN